MRKEVGAGGRFDIFLDSDSNMNSIFSISNVNNNDVTSIFG